MDNANPPDLKLDLLNLIDSVYYFLDSSIKIKLNNPGLVITQNIYTGFDTEFYKDNTEQNKIVSAQLAICTKTYLKIPIYKDDSLTTLHPLKDELFEPSTTTVMNSTKVESLMNDLLKIAKSKDIHMLEKSINKLVNGLVSSKIPY